MSDHDMHWTELVEQARELDHDPATWPDLPMDEDTRALFTLHACELFWGHGFADDSLGDVDGFGHFYRVSRWTVETDSRGFSDVTEHGSEREAMAWWATLEEEYAEWLAEVES